MDELLQLDLKSRGVTTQFTAPTSEYSIVFSDLGARITLPFSSTTGALAFDAETADWVFAAARKLENIAKLKRNWDSYDGLPLSPVARQTTYDALDWLKHRDLPVPAVVLGSAGTVHLEWYFQGKELEIGFENDGTVEYCKIENDGRADEGQEKQNYEIKKRLMQLAKWLGNGNQT